MYSAGLIFPLKPCTGVLGSKNLASVPPFADRYGPVSRIQSPVSNKDRIEKCGREGERGRKGGTEGGAEGGTDGGRKIIDLQMWPWLLTCLSPTYCVAAEALSATQTSTVAWMIVQCEELR